MDTACSSSLVATAIARQALSGNPATAAAAAGAAPSRPLSCSSALVGGINMLLLSSTSHMFQKAGMLAADGRCKALDAAADGYVRSEALAMMLMVNGEVEGASALLAGEAWNSFGCERT